MLTSVDYALFALNSYSQTSSSPTSFNGATIYEIGGVPQVDEDAGLGYFAVAYQVGDEVVISYRGTDNPMDVVSGWPTGAGVWDSGQAPLALDFYNDIRNSLPDGTTITLTGHSLGGGLAGYVASLSDAPAVIFDNMPFELAAARAQIYYAAVSLILDMGETVTEAFAAAATQIAQINLAMSPALSALGTVLGVTDDNEVIIEVEGEQETVAFGVFEELRDMLLPGITTTEPADITAHAIDGEVLTALRVLQSTPVQDHSPYFGGDDRFDLSDLLGVLDFIPDALDFHSMALLTAQLAYESLDETQQSRIAFIGGALSDAFFDDDIATATGFGSAAEMFTAIANSAVSGAFGQPNGTSALAAAFDDAEDVGEILDGAEFNFNLGLTYSDFAVRGALADGIAQFAAFLAQNGATDNTEGFIRSDGNRLISIDYSDALWSSVSGNPGFDGTDVIGRDTVIDRMDFDDYFGNLFADAIENAMATLWGTASTMVLERLHFLRNNDDYTFGATVDLSPIDNSFGNPDNAEGHGDALEGTEYDDDISGSARNELLIGGDGDDTIFGAAGDDLLVPGDGEIQYIDGGDGEDYVIFYENYENLVGYNFTIFELPESSEYEYVIQENTLFGTGTQVYVRNVEWAQFDAETIQLNEVAQPIELEDVIPAFLFAGGTFRPDSVTYTGALEAIRLLPDGWQISGPDLTVGIERGVFLSTGGLPGSSNTSDSFTVSHNTPGDPRLDAAANDAYSGAGSTQDAALIEFEFDSSYAGGAESIRFDLFFGSDEYPEFVDSSFVDIAGVFVNGTNYALFNNSPAQPLSIVASSINTAGNFINNESGAYNTEYDGFSVGLTVVAPIQEGTNTVMIGIADTGDTAYDSGIFIGNVQATNLGSGGSFLNVQGSNDSEEFNPNAAPELVNLGGGQDTVAGTPEELNGDVLEGWADDDLLIYEGVTFGLDDITITMGSAILDIDLDGDGTPDTTITLEGDFEGATFAVENVDGATQITSTGAAGAESSVAILGVLAQNEILSLDVDIIEALTPDTTPSHQWFRDGVAIAGAVGDTYTLTQDDVGASITAQVTYQAGFGVETSIESEASVAVANVNDDPTGDVLITGEALQGETLTADASGVEDLDGLGELSYQWYRDGEEIDDAEDDTYTLTQDDVGAEITVQISYTDGEGTDEEVTSAATDPIEPAAMNLVGTPDDDLLQGGAYDDTISGLDGTDTLVGNGGNDSMIGGMSEDDLRDNMYGGDGNDFLDGGYGNDLLRGDAGDDSLTGGFGADTVIGGDDNDVLTAQAWGDLLFGGEGDDFINGGFGYDRANGGDGADRFFHLGVAGHGSDWIQDYDASEGDVLQFGGAGANVGQFQVNFVETQNAGQAGVDEAFVIYRPTGQILWALVDGGAQSEINIMISGTQYDLLA